MHVIKYTRPALHWYEALPIGNGFTGIMAYGSLMKERLCFNDTSLWSGYPKDYNNHESAENLKNVRQLIFDGKNAEADALCEKKLCGFYSEAFMPLGEITLNFKGISYLGYSRSLDLSNAVHTVESNGCKAELLSSYPDKISVYQIKTNTPFSVKIEAKSKLLYELCTHANSLFLMGNAPDYAAPSYLKKESNPIRYDEKRGMAFCLQTQVQTNGSVFCKNNRIIVKNATQMTLYFVTATGFNSFDKMPETRRNIVKQKCIQALDTLNFDFDELKKRHVADYSALYNAQSISFNCDKDDKTSKILRLAKKGDELPLCELMYNYGKYLMVSGSRKGGQPLNLQGIWNNSVRPPWSSNYTVNINAQMNYWGASRCGLSECLEPLIQMVYETLQNGEKTAEINYACRGFACNHNVDLWRKTPPVKGDPGYMFAPLCSAWLSNELYAHYKNGFIKEYEAKIKEIVNEAARFASDYLVMHNGYYVVCPSVSPENVFVNIKGETCNLDYASAFDMGIVRQAFKNALEFSDDSLLKSEIAEKMNLLYSFKEGKNGICEWHKHYETPEKEHRHFSPLYAFYPANVIGYYTDKEQTEWIQKLFHHRTDTAKKYFGWSAAWAICLAARLREAETAQKIIRSMLGCSVLKNLLCVQPPFCFQIDANFGFVAGINEMLITEENGVVELIPALPENFASSGEVRNIVVNGSRISFNWKNGLVTKIQSDTPIRILNKNLSSNIKISNNISVKENNI